MPSNQHLTNICKISVFKQAIAAHHLNKDNSFYPDADTMKYLEVLEKFTYKWTGINGDYFQQFKMYRN